MTQFVNQTSLDLKVPSSFDEMVAEMLKCEQSEGVSVYQHGQAVAENVNLLIGHIRGDYALPADKYRIPSCYDTFGPQILQNLHTDGVIQSYALHHDCGKPQCIEIDPATSRRSFPDHAAVSRSVWLAVGGDETVGRLIANDMMVHTASSEEISRCLQMTWSGQDSVTLMLSALAELHANARMFGGIESSSFKIKYKQVERRSNQICKYCFAQ